MGFEIALETVTKKNAATINRGILIQLEVLLPIGSDLRSAKDIAQDVAEAAIISAVAAVVVVTTILAKSFRIAPQKSTSKLLRASVSVVVRTLRVIALAAASITRPSAQAGLVSLVQLDLGAIVVATIVPVTTIALVPVAVISIVPIIAATAIPVIVAIPSPISIPAIITTPATVIAILRLYRCAGNHSNSKY